MCFESTIDGMRWELEGFVQDVRSKWSQYANDVPAHDEGLGIFVETARSLSKHDAAFKKQYSIEDGGWGPNHPQWYAWPHIRQTLMPKPKLRDDSSEEFDELDFHGKRRLTFLLHILENVAPFVEAWREQRTRQASQDAEGNPVWSKEYTTSRDRLREAIQAFQDVLAEPGGPLLPTNDPLYLARCTTDAKGMQLELRLPDAAWGIKPSTHKTPALTADEGDAVGEPRPPTRKRPTPLAGEGETPRSHLKDHYRSSKRQKTAMLDLGSQKEKGNGDGPALTVEACDTASARPADQGSGRDLDSVMTEIVDQENREDEDGRVAASHNHGGTNPDGIDMFKPIRDKITRPGTFFDD